MESLVPGKSNVIDARQMRKGKEGAKLAGARVSPADCMRAHTLFCQRPYGHSGLCQDSIIAGMDGGGQVATHRTSRTKYRSALHSGDSARKNLPYPSSRSPQK